VRVKSSPKFINPKDYILSVLSPEDRLDAALKIAKEAFKNSKPTITEIDNAVRMVRRKTCVKKK